MSPPNHPPGEYGTVQASARPLGRVQGAGADTRATPVPDQAWRWHGLALLALWGLLAWAYRDTWGAMVAIWLRSDTYAHALVVPPISAWLIWRRRSDLLATRPRAMPLMALPMAALVMAWALGELVATNALTQAMAMAMVVAAVPAVLGWPATRTVLFPLGFLFFAVPVGDFLTPWLMKYTADFTVSALRLSGVPVYREGLQFVIPSGHWSVVEACSGIRYLMASLMAGTLFAYLNYRSHRRRWVFVGVSIAVPIVANWLRAYMIVMLGHLSNNRIATGVDHLLYGWVFFGVVIMLMFFVGARWSEPDAPSAAPATALPAHAAAAASFRWPALAGAWLLLAAVLLPPPVATAWLAARGPSGPVQLALPERWADGTAAVHGQLAKLADWQPQFTPASAQDQRVYAAPQGTVAVHVGYYERQDAQRKLVSSENVLVRSDDHRWNVLPQARLPLALPQGTVAVAAATLLGQPELHGGPRVRLRVWRLYWVNGRFLANDWEAKLAQAMQVLSGGGDGGAMLLLYTEADAASAAAVAGGAGVSDAADARLAAFAQSHATELDALLRALRTR